MRRLPLLLLLACVLPAWLATAADPVRRANIVLIVADDLGWRDVGYQGSDYYETPRLDALARQGMIFSQAYAGGGNCVPSRACLLSGQYTPRHGVYAVGDTNRGPRHLMRLVPIPSKTGLPRKQTTLADALKAAGYATGIFGKWHLGGKDGAPPAAQGFDVVVEARGQANQRGESDDPKGVFSLANAACAFIEENKDGPFFCFLSHHAIHTPLQCRPQSLEKFQHKPAGKQHQHALYAACLFDLDDAVGQLLDKLAELKQAQNTLVIFTSDNGGTQQSSQEPLRGNKGCYYEGGIRVPLLAYWPGVIAPGTTCDVPVHNVDLFPTFLDAAGVPPAPDTVLDGESLLPLLRGQQQLKRTAIFWHFPGYLDDPVIRGRDTTFRTRPVSVIRKGDWKLHLFHEEWQLDGGREKLASNNAVELYDLKNDAGERDNLASSRTEKRDELLAELLQWMKAIGAPLPTQPNAAYNPSASK